LVSPEKQKELHGREKVGSPGKVVSPMETLWLGIGCSIVRREEWGFFGQYKGCLSYEGKGTWPEERLVSTG
jgi:hypothetical protein